MRTRGAWATCLVAGHIPAHTWLLGFLPMSWALLNAHVALVLRWVSHDRSLLETSGAWVIVPDSKGMGWMS